MRSPSMIVGFIDPVGTSLQSATALRNITISTTKIVTARSSRQAVTHPAFSRSSLIGSMVGTASPQNYPRASGLLDITGPRLQQITDFSQQHFFLAGLRWRFWLCRSSLFLALE